MALQRCARLCCYAVLAYIFLCLALLVIAHYFAEFRIDAYDGPRTCKDEDRVANGKQISIHYTGTIHKDSKTGVPGHQFDSSRGPGRDVFKFNIGEGTVIPGWDKGLMGLCKGVKATLEIPPEMGYDEDGAGDDIPGGAMLHFDVEVVDVVDAADASPPPNPFVEIDTNKDNLLDKLEIEAYFTTKGREVPEGLWNEDINKDGFISWAEFTGPKGDKEPEYSSEL